MTTRRKQIEHHFSFVCEFLPLVRIFVGFLGVCVCVFFTHHIIAIPFSVMEYLYSHSEQSKQITCSFARWLMEPLYSIELGTVSTNHSVSQCIYTIHTSINCDEYLRLHVHVWIDTQYHYIITMMPNKMRRGHFFSF